MPCVSENLDLLKPLAASADAEKVFNLREKNNAPAANEATWIAVAHAQHAILSAAEDGFFEELDRRMSL